MNLIKTKLNIKAKYNLISLCGCLILAIIGILAILPGINSDVTAETFRYFTTLSNLFMSLVAVICIPFYIFCLKNNDYCFPKWLQVIKMVATATVLLTFLTVVGFLGPVMGYGMMFNSFQLIIYHAVEPILAVILFIFIDITVKLNWKTTFFVLIPVFAYGIVYLICNFCGIWVTPQGEMTDHYGLIKLPFMFMVLVLVVYFSTLGIWELNKIRNKHVLDGNKNT